jgi:hypothetical protein
MGKPKKNKKAEIKQRRKTRKAQERVDELRRREKMIRAYLKMISENAETMRKLAESESAEVTDSSEPELSSEPSVQSNQ